ncbi:MAG: DUF4388 domain-containing protein [Sandaracinaceae bacterium]|nr:DUF4388 domain-containing protein [Sandaracinaceae bacterium]
MAERPPTLRGELNDGGAVELLRQCELRRLTGLLRFWGSGPDDGVDGAVRLYGGEIAVEQPERDDGQDPVSVLLELESGRYELAPSLPPLPVSRGDDVQKTGSLAVHVPVDLMSYCEHAGLTGVLELTHEGRRAEAFYDSGELLAIELDGRDATDLHEVFAWEQGRFRVSLDFEAPARVAAEPEPIEEPSDDGWSPAPPQKRESTRQFLRVVEMALVDVLDRSERARSPTRTSPPLPPPPPKRPRPQSIPPPPRRRGTADQTVRLVYLSADPSPVRREEAGESTRHVRTDVPAEVVGARAEPVEVDHDERNPMAKKRRNNPSGKPPGRAAASEPPTAEAAEPGEPAPEPAAASARAPRAPAASGGATVARPDEPPLAAALKQIGGASAWALFVFVLGLAILYVLGSLPPVH